MFAQILGCYASNIAILLHHLTDIYGSFKTVVVVAFQGFQKIDRHTSAKLNTILKNGRTYVDAYPSVHKCLLKAHLETMGYTIVHFSAIPASTLLGRPFTRFCSMTVEICYFNHKRINEVRPGSQLAFQFIQKVVSVQAPCFSFEQDRQNQQTCLYGP